MLTKMNEDVRVKLRFGEILADIEPSSDNDLPMYGCFCYSCYKFIKLSNLLKL